MMDKSTCIKEIGEKLKKEREKKGISKYKVAKKGNIRIEMVKMVEDGCKNYTVKTLIGYLKGLGILM